MGINIYAEELLFIAFTYDVLVYIGLGLSTADLELKMGFFFLHQFFDELNSSYFSLILPAIYSTSIIYAFYFLVILCHFTFSNEQVHECFYRRR